MSAELLGHPGKREGPDGPGELRDLDQRRLAVEEPPHDFQLRAELRGLRLDDVSCGVLETQGSGHTHDPLLGGRQTVGLAGAGIGHAELLLHQVAQLLAPVVAPRRVQLRASGAPNLLHGASTAKNAVYLSPYRVRQPFDLIEVLGPPGVRGPFSGADDVDGSLHLLGGRLHQLHDHAERVFVAAPEVAAEPLAADGQHPGADLSFRRFGDGLDIVPDNAGAAAREDHDELGVVALVRLLHRFQEFSFTAVHHVGLVLRGA